MLPGFEAAGLQASRLRDTHRCPGERTCARSQVRSSYKHARLHRCMAACALLHPCSNERKCMHACTHMHYCVHNAPVVPWRSGVHFLPMLDVDALRFPNSLRAMFASLARCELRMTQRHMCIRLPPLATGLACLHLRRLWFVD